MSKLFYHSLIIFSAFVGLCMVCNGQDTTGTRAGTSSPYGIGTTTPLGTLHVHETAVFIPDVPPVREDGLDRTFENDYRNAFLMTNTNTGTSRSNDGFLVEQFNYDVTLRQLEKGYLRMLGYPGTGVLIDTLGRVGIGTQSPTSLLHVAGAAKFDGDITAQTNLSVGATLWVTGNAFLGDGFKCYNNGTVKCKEVIVTLEGWSDFVFDDGYRLMSLGELESYINQHHHLPDVPSAKEVENGGVNIGEMNATLLQKIEELTLYIIELQKQIDELRKQ
ncbi:MAG: hypothetical protein K5864_07845 [Bacteroidales bacterium]|nr:hypothetical protein [Bacteroidales bacterium]